MELGLESRRRASAQRTRRRAIVAPRSLADLEFFDFQAERYGCLLLHRTSSTAPGDAALTIERSPSGSPSAECCTYTPDAGSCQSASKGSKATSPARRQDSARATRGGAIQHSNPRTLPAISWFGGWCRWWWSASVRSSMRSTAISPRPARRVSSRMVAPTPTEGPGCADASSRPRGSGRTDRSLPRDS